MSDVCVEISLFSLISPFQVIFFVQLSFPRNIEHASLTFNEYKVEVKIYYKFLCVVTFQPPCIYVTYYCIKSNINNPIANLINRY